MTLFPFIFRSQHCDYLHTSAWSWQGKTNKNNSILWLFSVVYQNVHCQHVNLPKYHGSGHACIHAPIHGFACTQTHMHPGPHHSDRTDLARRPPRTATNQKSKIKPAGPRGLRAETRPTQGLRACVRACVHAWVRLVPHPVYATLIALVSIASAVHIISCMITSELIVFR